MLLDALAPATQPILGMLLDPAPLVPPPTIVPPTSGVAAEVGHALEENAKLETLLEHLAADVYQD